MIRVVFLKKKKKYPLMTSVFVIPQWRQDSSVIWDSCGGSSRSHETPTCFLQCEHSLSWDASCGPLRDYPSSYLHQSCAFNLREDKATYSARALSGLAPEATLNSQTLLFLQEESKGQLPPTPQLTLGEYFVYFKCSEHFLSSSTALGNMLDFFTNILSCIFDQNVGR